jgi:hypothetical protein
MVGARILVKCRLTRTQVLIHRVGGIAILTRNSTHCLIFERKSCWIEAEGVWSLDDEGKILVRLPGGVEIEVEEGDYRIRKSQVA